jgi:hypothetical protein
VFALLCNCCSAIVSLRSTSMLRTSAHIVVVVLRVVSLHCASYRFTLLVARRTKVLLFGCPATCIRCAHTILSMIVRSAHSILSMIVRSAHSILSMIVRSAHSISCLLYIVCTRVYHSLHSWWKRAPKRNRAWCMWELKVLVWCKKYPAVAGYFIICGCFYPKLKSKRCSG